jgi:hypothetical protein
MPNLAGFAAFAERVGKLTPARENSVPLVPQPGERWGTTRGTEEHKQQQLLSNSVPRVPLVPLENSQAENEEDLRVAFEERAAILEYDGGWPRPEAERLARIEVFGPE